MQRTPLLSALFGLTLLPTVGWGEGEDAAVVWLEAEQYETTNGEIQHIDATTSDSSPPPSEPRSPWARSLARVGPGGSRYSLAS